MTLAHRLGVRPGDRLLLLNAPERYLRLLELPPEVHIDLGPLPGSRYDHVHLFALDEGTVRREAVPTLGLVGPDTLLWICYPRRGGTIITDLSADKGWDAVTEQGWRSTAQEMVDSDWAALRFERFRQTSEGVDRE